MIRVLHVVDTLNRGSGVMGVIMNYYQHIDRNRIQFDFLYFIESEDSYRDEILSLGGDVFKLPMLTGKNILFFSRNILRFFSKVKNRYPIMHLHEVLLGSLLLPIAKINGIKVRIVHSHNSVAAETTLKAVRNRFLTTPLKVFATDFFSCSDLAGEFLYGKKYMSKGKVKILNNAVDTLKFSYNPDLRQKILEELKIPNNATVIGHVGRFSKQKNHSFLIDVFFEFTKTNPNSYLVLIGTGELLKKIKNKVNRLNISNHVIFTGQVSNVSDYLNAFDLLLMPSFFEGLPVVGVEAQASGVSCIFSDAITRTVQITDNVAFVSLSRSLKEWVENIQRLLSKGSLCRSNNISEFFEAAGFSINVEAKKLEKYYLLNLKRCYI